ncbi:hypothetical protein K469DRAFT_715797 [Zopfia rhizophila CBS 207.26]|uniref:Uncharacterized protein n=1 Tax=Zopfia rhizophila CBS 207.26 TaxID=1314779 RepID=A0A6A6DNF5_9PEZI|nr:hypothetical protein K469DRAFT_715797 [Zopfia rhizophila CBS 207.26]
MGIENRLKYSIFLPDNSLRPPRLTSTRESQEGREDTVKHFIANKLQCSNRRVYITKRQQHHQQLRTYLSKHDTLYTTHN